MTTIRALTEPDIPAAAEVQLNSFDDLDRRQRDQPAPITDARREWVGSRLRHFLVHDPDGSFVATSDDGEVTGVALALVRGDLWGLSLLVVAPGLQSAGTGRRLLDASLGYAQGCDRAVILSSSDPRAMRLYATSGFDLHPQVEASGVPDLRDCPAGVERVRPAEPDDAAVLEEIDQQVRRATRGTDHMLLGARSSAYLCHDDAGSGYAYCTPDGHVAALSATDEVTAGDLLWRCFTATAAGGASATVGHITAGQQWAVRTALAARLSLRPVGPVLWRGGSPPPAYLPSGALL